MAVDKKEFLPDKFRVDQLAYCFLGCNIYCHWTISVSTVSGRIKIHTADDNHTSGNSDDMAGKINQ